jgi:hypothetical protein
VTDTARPGLTPWEIVSLLLWGGAGVCLVYELWSSGDEVAAVGLVLTFAAAIPLDLRCRRKYPELYERREDDLDVWAIIAVVVVTAVGVWAAGSDFDTTFRVTGGFFALAALTSVLAVRSRPISTDPIPPEREAELKRVRRIQWAAIFVVIFVFNIVGA